jgi:hypothetical protein
VIPTSFDRQAWVMAEAAVAVIDAVLELVLSKVKWRMQSSPLRPTCLGALPVCGPF